MRVDAAHEDYSQHMTHLCSHRLKRTKKHTTALKQLAVCVLQQGIQCPVTDALIITCPLITSGDRRSIRLSFVTMPLAV